jgi:NADP-dependent 3-hydroxy acid dehydrogenase YdfG
MKKVLFGLLIAIMAMPIFELLREYAVYQNSRWRLNAAAQKLKYDMTHEQVRQIMGSPDQIGKGFINVENDDDEVWNWKSVEDQGLLRRRLGLSSRKPPLEITAWFHGKGLLYVLIENN